MHSHEPEGYVCPLCQIADGQPTALGLQEDSVLYRDEHIVVFIAGKWWHAAPGHIILMPRAHIENLYVMPKEIGHRIFDFTQKAALALKEAYGCDGISTRQHNEPAGNQDVWHYHQHVHPRFKDDRLYVRHEETFWTDAAMRRPYVEKLKPFFQ